MDSSELSTEWRERAFPAAARPACCAHDFLRSTLPRHGSCGFGPGHCSRSALPVRSHPSQCVRIEGHRARRGRPCARGVAVVGTERRTCRHVGRGGARHQMDRRRSAPRVGVRCSRAGAQGNPRAEGRPGRTRGVHDRRLDCHDPGTHRVRSRSRARLRPRRGNPGRPVQRHGVAGDGRIRRGGKSRSRQGRGTAPARAGRRRRWSRVSTRNANSPPARSTRAACARNAADHPRRLRTIPGESGHGMGTVEGDRRIRRRAPLDGPAAASAGHRSICGPRGERLESCAGGRRAPQGTAAHRCRTCPPSFGRGWCPLVTREGAVVGSATRPMSS